MKNNLTTHLKSSLAVTALSASANVFAANAVVVNGHLGDLNMSTHLLTQIAASNDTQAFTSNPDLDSAAWGHAGTWWTFHTHMAQSTTISAVANGDIAPGFALWRTDGLFDGGTADGFEQSTAGKGVPHSFNQVGNPGDFGTIWMTDDSLATAMPGQSGLAVNGILESIGYASDGPDQAQNGWGGSVASDGNRNGIAALTFDSIMHGDYLIFVGGADGTLSGGTIDLSVSQVPVPAAVYLFGTAVFGLMASARRGQPQLV